MTYRYRCPSRVRMTLNELTSETIETIAEMVLDLRDDLDAMTEERDDWMARATEAGGPA